MQCTEATLDKLGRLKSGHVRTLHTVQGHMSTLNMIQGNMRTLHMTLDTSDKLGEYKKYKIQKYI